MQINPFSIPPFIAAILTSLLGLFIYSRNRKSSQNIAYSLECLCVFLWFLAYSIMFSCKDEKIASIWGKLGYAGVTFIPITFYHFTISLIGIRKHENIIRTIYAIGGVFLILLFFTDFYISGVNDHFWGFYTKANFIHPVYLLFFMILYSGSLILLFKHMKLENINLQQKNRIKYVFWAFFIPAFASVDFTPSYGFDIYPFGYMFIFAWLSITAYAIVKHQLLEIELIIKRTLVFATLFVIALGIVAGITLITQELIAGGRLLGLAIGTMVIVLTVRPLENFLINITDKYLFQKKYGYKQVLRSFLDEVITVLNLDRIINSTFELLDKVLHPENAIILLLDRYEDKYLAYKTSKYTRDIILENNSKLVVYLKTTKDIFSLDQSENPVRVTKDLKNEMDGLGSRVAIPLTLHNDLIGIILLGKKKSDIEYTEEDLDILQDLARTETIAIGNAQLFAESAQNERRAAIGTLSASINHEIGNPLNIIGTKMQVYLMSLSEGLYKDKKPEEIIEKSKEVMNVALQQIDRISDITKKLSSFASPSRSFKPGLINIEERLDETLAIISHELKLEKIEIKKDIQKSLPQILADKGQIQQIFFNIIRNAGQAIEKKGIITIKAYSEKFAGINNIHIEISDTGHGIPEDKINKIYDPFFTTKGKRGTGLGLSVVRQLVWRNRGDIKVKSKINEGTTFTLIFPEGQK